MQHHCCIGKSSFGRIPRCNHCILIVTSILTFLLLGEIQYKIIRNSLVLNGATKVEAEDLDLNFTCFVPLISKVVSFFNYGIKKKNCRKQVGFGGPLDKERFKKNYDGEKIVCLDEEYNIKPGNCTVLSFGIGNDWSFDDAMAKFGCKVYSFDPSIGLKDFNRSENIQFFNLGLDDNRRLIKFGDRKGMVDRYKNILEKYNLIDREIDYLKIDIEGYEVNFFKDIFGTSRSLLKNVKQIGMEIHVGKVNHNQQLVFPTSSHERIFPLWNGMKQLECEGFQLLYFEPNRDAKNLYKWNDRDVSTCYEAAWGKLPRKKEIT